MLKSGKGEVSFSWYAKFEFYVLKPQFKVAWSKIFLYVALIFLTLAKASYQQCTVFPKLVFYVLVL